MDKDDTRKTNGATDTALEIKEYTEASFDENDDDNGVGERKESGTRHEETNDDAAGTGSEIKEYSEASFDENDDDNGVGESKDNGINNESESMEESPDYPTSRSKTNEECHRDMAQQKKNRRASRAQPGAKRGGRRDTRRSGWRRRLLGDRKIQFQAGDLVEAEWAGSGWWYVGFVGGGEEFDGAANKVKAGKRSKEVHIIFIDGDEADVRRKDLKLLGTTGQPAGNRDTALPRHMPVVDLGTGRLHGNQEPPSNQRQNAEGEGKAKGHKSENNDNNIHQESGEEGTPHSPLPRRGSVGNIKDRVEQGKHAVWGGRGAPDGGTRNGGVDGDWWDTGTPYAFQPRLAADKTTVLSFVDTGGYRDRGVGLDRRGVLRGSGGGREIDSPADRTDSVASGLSVQYQQRQLQGGHGTSREMVRIVKVPENNEHHGQRLFFLA